MENVKIGFRWFIRRETFRGFEEYEPHEETFATYEECVADAECNYPEYSDFGVILCEDDDGFITELYKIKDPKKIYQDEKE